MAPAVPSNSLSCGGSRVGCRPTSRCRRHVRRLDGLVRWRACLYRSRRPAFAEIPQQRRPPAMARFRIRDHGAQLLVCDALLAFTLFLNETPLFHHIAHTEEQHALARQTIRSEERRVGKECRSAWPTCP